MKKIREILRQKWVLGSSHRDEARSLGVSVGAVSSAVARATHAGLTWSDVEALGEVELEHRLFGARSSPARRVRCRISSTCTRNVASPV
ncbi:hypothetical protein [Paraliomyxa miuraensis]|uniref:hypothetical protein n=1 Tax=Paraliomyxa miuraensis TaxID=376150 RepID=UPI0022542089|nr:hypothetical protein [Paraliomyxa miuraensis]